LLCGRGHDETGDVNGSFVVLPGLGAELDLGNYRAEILATAQPASEQFTLLKTFDKPPDSGRRYIVIGTRLRRSTSCAVST
jgi:hypothetical protein